MLKIFTNAALAIAMVTAAYSMEDPKSDSEGSISPPPRLQSIRSPKGTDVSPADIRVLSLSECPASDRTPTGTDLTAAPVTKISAMDSFSVNLLSTLRRDAISKTNLHTVNSALGLSETDLVELEARSVAITRINALRHEEFPTCIALNEYETIELARRIACAISFEGITAKPAIAFSKLVREQKESSPLKDGASLIDQIEWTIANVKIAIDSYNASDNGAKYPIANLDAAMEIASRFPLIPFSF